MNIHDSERCSTPWVAEKFLPKWYVLVAGKTNDACSARARPALKMGIICITKR